MLAHASWLLLVTLPAAVGGLASARARSAELGGLTLAADSTGAVLEWRLSERRSPNVLRLANPERLVIDLPATRGPAAARPPPPGGVVAALRAGPRAGGAFRLVLEFRRGAPTDYRLSSHGDAGAVSYRLQVGKPADVAPVDASPAGAPQASDDQPLRPAHAVAERGRDIVIAVDAGHGGVDPGASGPGGTQEKDITLAIARALVAELEQLPGFHAVLTREGDRLIDLRERVERAHAAHADLFVSIHADSVRDHGIAGASVYTLSYHGASSETARVLADRENAAVLKGGVSLAGVDPRLASVLADVAKEAAMGSSVEAADEVLAGLDHVGMVRKREVHHAGFVVLKSIDIPSMLVETAYISNPGEERKLRSAAYQQRLAGAIAAGLASYFRLHPPDGTRP
jgi:N-acetylmuramoyl-L-alanine amidase